KSFVGIDDVPDVQLSLKEVAKLFSNLGGQGPRLYSHCNCDHCSKMRNKEMQV
ncbi:KRAB-A domain-containing protein 2-like, partial [Aphis craccivora]